MELLLLGTAAAEGWPAPFCLCEGCETARRRGGTNLRTRSGALIDDDLKIDFNSDTLIHMQRSGRHLANLKTLIFTHQHSDHIIASELEWAVKPFTNTPLAEPLAIYGNAQVLEKLRAQFGDGTKHNFQFFQLNPLEPVETNTGDKVLPLPADHVEGALVLRITRQGKTIFYGHDSGLYPAETLDALENGPKLDIALMDCTYGGQNQYNRGHMSISGVVQMTEELRKRGAITDQTRVVATHFSHNGGLLHEELVHEFLPHRIEVAFDGMVLKV